MKLKIGEKIRVEHENVGGVVEGEQLVTWNVMDANGKLIDKGVKRNTETEKLEFNQRLNNSIFLQESAIQEWIEAKI